MIIHIGKTCLDLRGGEIRYQVTTSQGISVGTYKTHEDADAKCTGTDWIKVIITGQLVGHKEN